MAKCKNCTNLYNLSDENDVIVGKWCPKTNDSPDVEAERECGYYYKRMTQADRIRSMSDEELAEIIGILAEGNEDCTKCPAVSYKFWCTTCKEGILERLQSEVEE